LSRSTLNYWVVFVFAVLALWLCVSFVQSYAVNGVWQDEWAFIPYLRDLQAGKLDLWQLFISQHNEHRLCVAVFVLILIGAVTQYNGVAISMAGLGVIVLSVIMMCMIAWRRAKNLPFGVLFLIPVILVGLSLRQWENMICVCPFAPLFPPCTFIATILLLEGIEASKFVWLRVSLAIFLAFCGTFSFANGILAFPLGLVTLFLPSILNKKSPSTRTKLSALVFGGAGLIVLGTYAMTFTGFGPNAATHLSISKLVTHPAVCAKRLLLCLATPLVGVADEAYVIGALLTGVLLATIFLLVKNRTKLDQTVVAPSMLVCFGLLSTLMIWYARAEAPTIFFLSSHYASFLNLWVIGIYAMLLGLVSSPLGGLSRRLAITTLSVLTLIMIVSPFLSMKEGAETGEVIRTVRLAAANKLLNWKIQSDTSLLDECYSAKWVRYLAPYIEENHLSIFANSSSPVMDAGNVQPTNGNIACHIECAGPAVDTTATTTHEGPPVINYPVAKVAGWIEEKTKPNKVARILVETDAGVTYEAASSLYRLDLVARYKDESLKRSGFCLVCDPRKAIGLSKSISIIAEDKDGQRFLLAKTEYGSTRKGDLAQRGK
jgi:hypothetical protein